MTVSLLKLSIDTKVKTLKDLLNVLLYHGSHKSKLLTTTKKVKDSLN